MPVLLLPDLIAMVFLTLVVALVRRKFEYEGAGLWTVGLVLIVLECSARVLYLTQLPLVWHHVMHAVALDAYCVAGVVFLRAAMPSLRRMPHGGLYLAINVSPLLMMMTLYGLDLKAVIAYRILAINGLTVGLLSAAVLRQRWKHLLTFLVMWAPLIVATTQANFRIAIYLSLFLLYGLIALAFAMNLPDGSKGRLLISAGFACWSACFATHPWVASWGKVWVQLAGEVWDMQKFLITVGFVLLLFECQVWNTEWLALHDQLTGLPNRRLYEDRLATAMARAERNGSPMLLFNLDLDGFKTVNDTMGHDAGDALLLQIGKNLQACVRKADTLARLGGDEFSMLAVDLERSSEGSVSPWPARLLQDQAERIAQTLRAAVEKPMMLEGLHGEQVMKVSTSIGIAIYPTDSTDIAELCRIADRRMYEDKQRRDRERSPALNRILAMMPA